MKQSSSPPHHRRLVGVVGVAVGVDIATSFIDELFWWFRLLRLLARHLACDVATCVLIFVCFCVLCNNDDGDHCVLARRQEQRHCLDRSPDIFTSH
jgi:hypothetical protein